MELVDAPIIKTEADKIMDQVRKNISYNGYTLIAVVSSLSEETPENESEEFLYNDFIYTVGLNVGGPAELIIMVDTVDTDLTPIEIDSKIKAAIELVKDIIDDTSNEHPIVEDGIYVDTLGNRYVAIYGMSETQKIHYTKVANQYHSSLEFDIIQLVPAVDF